MLDMLIKNALVYDGTGAAPAVRCVGVKDGKIVCVSEACDQPALVEIDGEGLCLAPGFIDSHSHKDIHFFMNQLRENLLLQGVTTEVGGQCGWSVAPHPKSAPEDYRNYIAALRKQPDFETFGEYLEYLDTVKTGTNTAVFVGYNALRGTVMGMKTGEPTAEELSRICALAEEAMQAGALGFSVGLVYAPCVYAYKAELVAVARVVKRYGGRFTAHIRDEGDRLIEAVEEVISIGEAGGVPVNISHLKALFPENFHKIDTVLEMIDQANARGVEVTFDAYPYSACAATILSTLPPSYLSHGMDWLMEHLEGKENIEALRKAIYEPTEIWENPIAKIGVENHLIAKAAKTPQIEGMRISEYAQANGLDGIEAYAQIIRLNGGSVEDIRFAMSEENLEKIYRHPRCMVGSDGLYKGDKSPAHVRAFATFPKYLADFIRDKKLLPMEEGIRRITGMPADIYGLTGKGYVKEGYDADLVLFHKEKLCHKATYADPFVPNEGIHMVIVNGKAAVVDNELTGVMEGKKILRKV